MAWNDELLRYEVDSDTTALQRLVDEWNKQVPNANITINNIKGTGLEGAFYTWLYGYYVFLQTGITGIQDKMIYSITRNQEQILRPSVVKDNIPAYASALGETMTIFDANDKKMAGLEEGIYLVFKNAPLSSSVDLIFKNCIVAGVVMKGNTNQDILLSNNQTLTAKYTIAQPISIFKIKIIIERKLNNVDQSSTINEVKTSINNYYANDYKLGQDFNPTDIYNILDKDIYTDFIEITCYYSLDGTNYIEGGYQVPYDKYLNISSGDVIVEVI